MILGVAPIATGGPTWHRGGLNQGGARSNESGLGSGPPGFVCSLTTALQASFSSLGARMCAFPASDMLMPRASGLSPERIVPADEVVATPITEEPR